MFTSEDRRWRGYLSYLISDCLENYGNRVSDIELYEKDITELLKEYHTCSGKNFVAFKEDKLWFKTSMGLTIGIVNSNFSFERAYEYRYLSTNYNSLSPMFGLSFILNSPRIDERAAIQVESNILKSSFESFYEEGGFRPGQHRVYADLVTVSVPLYFRYSLPLSETSLTIQAGFIYDLYLSKQFILKSSYWVREEWVPTPDVEAFEMGKHKVGLSGGIGVQRAFGKIDYDFVLRYTYLRSLKPLSSFEPYNFDNSRWSIMVTLRKA